MLNIKIESQVIVALVLVQHHVSLDTGTTGTMHILIKLKQKSCKNKKKQIRNL